jgi:RNA polymerase sigma-B factor
VTADLPGRWSRDREEDAESLFAELRRTGDPRARERLVQLHENLARFLASKFANRGEPLEDLVQVAMIGLIHAVDRYDPARGTRFSTYAAPTIVGEIKRHFRDRAWNMKVPRSLQELNHQVIRANHVLGSQLGRPPNVSEIAAYLGYTEEQTLDAIELGNAYETLSLDTGGSGEGEEAQPLSEQIGAEDFDFSRIEFHDQIRSAMRKLGQRERLIIYLRFFKDLSQTEVARRLSISQMHVSRLQQRALRQLRRLLSDDPSQEPVKA